RGGKRADSALSVPAHGAPGIHLPLSLAGGLGRAVGQSLHPAQSDQRLSRLPPRHAPRHARRRPAPLRPPNIYSERAAISSLPLAKGRDGVGIAAPPPPPRGRPPPPPGGGCAATPPPTLTNGRLPPGV